MLLQSFLSTLFATLLCSGIIVPAESLAFVSLFVRTPVAALQAVTPTGTLSASQQQLPATRALQAHSRQFRTSEDDRLLRVLESTEARPEFSHDDDTIRNQRSQIVDLVYERSLERMNGFSGDS